MPLSGATQVFEVQPALTLHSLRPCLPGLGLVIKVRRHSSCCAVCWGVRLSCMLLDDNVLLSQVKAQKPPNFTLSGATLDLVGEVKLCNAVVACPHHHPAASHLIS